MKPIEYSYREQLTNYYIGVTFDGFRLVHTVTDNYAETEELIRSFVYSQVSDEYPQLTSLEVMQLMEQKYPYQIKHVTIQESKQPDFKAYLPKERV